MADNKTLAQRWDALQATKIQVFWACAACAGAAVTAGFMWGGWVTGGTALDMASRAANGARAELAAAVCVERFNKAPDMTAKLASLKSADSWKRDDMLEKDGWVTLAGIDRPIAGAAALCVRALMDPKPAATTKG